RSAPQRDNIYRTRHPRRRRCPRDSVRLNPHRPFLDRRSGLDERSFKGKRFYVVSGGLHSFNTIPCARCSLPLRACQALCVGAIDLNRPRAVRVNRPYRRRRIADLEPSGSQTMFWSRLFSRNSVSILLPYLTPIITPDQRNGSFTLLVGRGIAPMLGRSDETCAHGIILYVLQLLPDGFVPIKRLRMKPFLPYLIGAGVFMRMSRLG